MLLLSELGGKRVNNPCGFWKDAYNHLATVGRDNSIRDTRAVEYRAFLYKVRGSTQFGSVLQDIHENICVALPGDPFRWMPSVLASEPRYVVDLAMEKSAVVSHKSKSSQAPS